MYGKSEMHVKFLYRNLCFCPSFLLLCSETSMQKVLWQTCDSLVWSEFLSSLPYGLPGLLCFSAPQLFCSLTSASDSYTKSTAASVPALLTALWDLNKLPKWSGVHLDPLPFSWFLGARFEPSYSPREWGWPAILDLGRIQIWLDAEATRFVISSSVVAGSCILCAFGSGPGVGISQGT